MIALIAVALAVSAVIFARGGEVVDDLERQNITVTPDMITNQVQCEQVYQWDWTAATNTCDYP